MMRRGFTRSIGFFALACCAGLYAAPVPGMLPPERRTAVSASEPVGASAKNTFAQAGATARLDRVAKLVEESNAPKLVGAEKWKALLRAYRAGLDGCRTHAQFATVVNRLFEDAGVSHFHYYTDEDWGYWHVRSAFGSGGPDARVEHIGIFPERIDGRWFVRGILEGGPADDTPIRIGDELVSVDGEPFAPVAPFRGRAGRPVRLTLCRTPASTYTVVITPVKESLSKAVQRAIRRSIRVMEHDGLRFAYMHGWTLLGSGGEYDELAKLQDDVDGLILDYRDGVGGTWMAATRFLVGSRGEHRSGRGAPTWTKPFVMLTADGTRSAKELVVDAVKRAGRGALVGEPTPGHVTAVGSFRRVGDDALVMLPGVSFDLEGHPTQPDYLVRRDIRYCGGEDPQLREGLSVLTELVDARRERSGAMMGR